MSPRWAWFTLDVFSFLNIEHWVKKYMHGKDFYNIRYHYYYNHYYYDHHHIHHYQWQYYDNDGVADSFDA